MRYGVAVKADHLNFFAFKPTVCDEFVDRIEMEGIDHIFGFIDQAFGSRKPHILSDDTGLGEQFADRIRVGKGQETQRTDMQIAIGFDERSVDPVARGS